MGVVLKYSALKQEENKLNMRIMITVFLVLVMSLCSGSMPTISQTQEERIKRSPQRRYPRRRGYYNRPTTSSPTLLDQVIQNPFNNPLTPYKAVGAVSFGAGYLAGQNNLLSGLPIIGK